MGGEQNSDGASMGERIKPRFPDRWRQNRYSRRRRLIRPPRLSRRKKTSLTTRIPDEGRTRAVLSQFVEPSGEPEKISSAGAGNGDGQAISPSVAMALTVATAADPLRDALAALDRRDYATAQRLFETCGQKDAAAAIEGAWAALDRRDYATAQRLFGGSLSPANVSGPKAGIGPVVRLLLRLRRRARDRRWRPIPGSTESRITVNQWCSLRRSSKPSATRSARKSDLLDVEVSFTWIRLVDFRDLRRLRHLWLATELDVRHREKPGDGRSCLSY